MHHDRALRGFERRRVNSSLLLAMPRGKGSRLRQILCSQLVRQGSAYGWLSKLWSRFGPPKYYTRRTTLRTQNGTLILATTIPPQQLPPRQEQKDEADLKTIDEASIGGQFVGATGISQGTPADEARGRNSRASCNTCVDVYIYVVVVSNIQYIMCNI